MPTKKKPAKKKAKNPNINCLADMRCPKCGSFGPFHIEAKIMVLVYDEGAEEEGTAYEWDSASYCECHLCHQTGSIETFSDK